jgi:acyl transferase domain-containing protein
MARSGGLGGSSREPLAIVGFSLKFPQDAISEESFWKMLLEGHMTRTDIPKSRMNVDAFYGGKQSGYDTVWICPLITCP